ncbi:MAG TPA: hypothetical protein P5161_01635 [Eubacteriales bacterium]|jgi:4-diphosphocytidyl-2C-methyl-D-erythritol kinase|nr:hypothetical protein [Clostridia bacterium]HRR89467.1 hypothetical protein [Eubacteriales bacterium]HRU83877.1 hypothetical protein [Eubacteriales bacterium]
MNEITLKTFAKINLTLSVFEKCGNLHKIDGVMSSVDLYDTVRVILRGDDKVTVSCSVELSGENTAKRAAEAVKSRFGTGGVDIIIKKSIPVGAGLGGSSADAAAVFRAMESLFRVKTEPAMQAAIGSDVPFMYRGGVARVGGTGEVISPLPYKKFECLLAVPPVMALAGGVYSKYDELGGENADTDAFIENWRSEGAAAAVKLGKNALERAALADDRLRAYFDKINQKIKDLGVDADVRLTGSGSGILIFSQNPHFLKEAMAENVENIYFRVLKSVDFGVKVLNMA